MSEIDPYQIGKLEEQVKQLQIQQTEMDKDIKELLALANKSKGGFWMGMAIASFVGGIISLMIKGWMH